MRHIILPAALLIVVSCGEPNTRPTPSPTPTPPASEITVSEITPASGATLLFTACGSGRVCTDQLRTTFDILVQGSVPNAIVVVSLYRVGLPCASAYIVTTLTSGNRASFSTSSMEVVHDEEGRPLCPLPAETTFVAFKVFFQNSPANAILSRELPYRYTLATQ